MNEQIIFVVGIVVIVWALWMGGRFLLPVAATKLMLRGNTRGAEMAARIALAMPLPENSVKTATRSLLARTLFSQKRYEEALDAYLSSTRSLDVSKEVTEAFLHCGDCHQALGQTDRAATAWGMAAKRAEALTDSYEKFEALSQLADRRNDRASGYTYLQRTLDYCTGAHARIRPVHMASLASDAALLMKLDESLEWCRRVVTEPSAQPMQILSAHRQAGLTYLILGNVDGARREALAAHTLASRTHRTADQQRTEVQIATVDMLSGQIGEALARLKPLTKMASFPTLMTTLALCHTWQGRYEEALAIRLRVLNRDTSTPWNANADIGDGVHLLACASIAAQTGRFAEGVEYLARAASSMENDRIRRPEFLALKAELLIGLNELDAARAIVKEIEASLPEIASHRMIANSCLPYLIQAQIDLEEYRAAKSTLSLRRSLGFLPVNEPRWHLQLGDCETALGNLAAARAAYERAGSFGIDTIHAHTAQERLTGLT